MASRCGSPPAASRPRSVRSASRTSGRVSSRPAKRRTVLKPDRAMRYCQPRSTPASLKMYARSASRFA
eukprot:13020649-Heterocapsa_arctica.AAC.1